MTNLGHVLAHKHPGVEKIRTIDGEIVISDDPDLHGWPPELGDIPSEEDQATWIAEYDTYKVIMDEIGRLEGLVTQRRIRDSVTTDDGKQWLVDQEALIAVEREKL